MDRKVTKIAIFASGAGTNAANLIKYFQASDTVDVDCIVTNRKNAGVYQIVAQLATPIFHFSNTEITEGKNVVDFLKNRKVDYLILSGFLLKIPPILCTTFANRIINIHPSLLPKYGGKGMYGLKVHEAVKHAKENESGITIHWVNENYDEGNIIFQQGCKINEADSVKDIQQKVQKLEHFYFPRIIEKTINRED